MIHTKSFQSKSNREAQKLPYDTKESEGIKMGFFYAGFKTNNSKNGYMKIGETNQKYLSSRIGKIRYDQSNFVVYDYMEIKNSTPSMTRAIEGHVRFRLEQFGLKQIQNDHFEYAIKSFCNDKETEFDYLSKKAMQYAMEYCNMMNIAYEVKSDKRNLKKIAKHK